jgi:hypothetical protein
MHVIGRGRYARETYPSRSTGAASDFAYQNRVDCSVNSAHVESTYASLPVLHAQSGGNTAGGYNGGGTGNKCILGFRAGNGLPLGSLSSIEWTWLDLNPATSGLPVYANVVIALNGPLGSAPYKIGVIDPTTLPALNNGTTVLNPNGSRTTTWLGASMNLLIVNGLASPGFAVGPPFVAPTVPGAPLPGGWPSNSYSLAAILAAYPGATLAEASTLDGGLPKAPNKTPPFMLVTGDSTNQIIRAFQLSDVRFNGALV